MTDFNSVCNDNAAQCRRFFTDNKTKIEELLDALKDCRNDRTKCETFQQLVTETRTLVHENKAGYLTMTQQQSALDVLSAMADSIQAINRLPLSTLRHIGKFLGDPSVLPSSSRTKHFTMYTQCVVCTIRFPEVCTTISRK